MAVRIRLSDGSAYRIDSEYAKIHTLAWTAMVEETNWIEVKNDKGLRRSINPMAIVSLEEMDEETPTPVLTECGSHSCR